MLLRVFRKSEFQDNFAHFLGAKCDFIQVNSFSTPQAGKQKQGDIQRQEGDAWRIELSG